MKSTRRFRRTIILTILLSISLVILAQSQVPGQFSESNKQSPVTVEAIPQPKNPLVITPTGIDNSYEYNLVIKFTVKNIGEKKIEAFVVTQQNSSKAQSGEMNFFSPVNVGQTLDSWNVEAKSNLKLDSKIFLSIGYILFADGSFWGKSTKKETDFIYGFIEGQKKMLSELKVMAKTDKAALVKLLEQEDFIIGIESSRIDKTKPEEWKVGYVVGYKTVWLELRPIYKKLGIEMLPLEPDEFYNSIEPIWVAR
jgi:hypothetical protein